MVTLHYKDTDDAIHGETFKEMPCDIIQAPTHRVVSEPLRMVAKSQDASVRNCMWEHIIFSQPIHPSIAILIRPFLGPCIVRMCAESVDRKDASGRMSRILKMVDLGSITYSTLVLPLGSRMTLMPTS